MIMKLSEFLRSSKLNQIIKKIKNQRFKNYITHYLPSWKVYKKQLNFHIDYQ